MKVSDAMLKDVHTIHPEETLDRAAELMLKYDYGSVPVADEEQQVIGMITDRDICMCGLIEGLPLNRLPIALAMTKELWACKPDDTLEQAQALMELHRVHRLPVLDGEQKLKGLLRLNDLLRASTNRKGPKAADLVRTVQILTERRVPADEAPEPLTTVGEPKTA